MYQDKTSQWAIVKLDAKEAKQQVMQRSQNYQEEDEDED